MSILYGVKMLILKYFKLLPKNDNFLIQMGLWIEKYHLGQNQKVSETTEKPLHSTRDSYLKLTPVQHFIIEKKQQNIELPQLTIRFFTKKHPDLGQCLERNNSQKIQEFIQQSQELLSKKNKWPLMVGDELDKQIREYISDLHARGVVINTSVVLASADV